MFKLVSVAAPVAALCLAACGAMTSAPGPAKMSNGVLVGANGMTLYTFDNDKVPGKSACNGPCAALWPPLMASASDQAKGDWTVVSRDDGTRQWAYRNKPVYFYQADKTAGDKTGDNFRSVWHTVKE
jgi:predicted lipoprotein with Yx(FWY)xxD motif